MKATGFYSNYDTNTWVHRLDPRVKMYLVLSFVIIPLLFTKIEYLLAVVVIFAPIWFSAKMKLNTIKGLIWAIIVFSLVALIFAAFYNYQIPGQVVLFTLGPLQVTDMSLSSGLTIGFRAAIPTLIILVLICTTDPAQLAKAMMKLKLPLNVAFMMLAALRFFPVISEEMSNISTAQTIRGIQKNNMKKRFRAFNLATLPLMVNSLRKSRTMGIAIESKGFGKRAWKEYYQELKLTKIDYLIIIFTTVCLATALILRYVYGLGVNPNVAM